MPALTRRRALHAATAIVAGFAGCSGESSSSSSYPSEAIGSLAVDPESYSLRNPDSDTVFWSGERPTTTGDDEGLHHESHRFVATPEDAASVSFADVPGADEARAFLEATDYDAETVYAEQWFVGECYAQELCYVQWSETEIETSYSRRYRDADVRCETDARDVVATLIRLPEPFDPSEVHGYGSSRGSSTCEERNERIQRRQDASDDGGEES
jgi:hypothetical protein